MKNKVTRLVIHAMKLSVYVFVFQVLALNFLVAENTNGQTYKSVRETFVSVNIQKTTLKNTFDYLETISDYHFNYDKEDIRSNKKIDLNYNNVPFSEVLVDISKEYEVGFRQLNDVIQVAKLSREADENYIGVVLEDLDITGKILDENGQGLPGAVIIEKGTTNGTTTDVDGNYKLRLSENATISVSYVGYKTVEFSVGGRSVIDIQMEVDAAELEEIVIIGYGSVKKSDLTGSVASVSTEDINAVPVSSIDQALQGRASGVRVVQNSGIPGAPTTIRIRGTNSISGGNKPLVIVDGFPVVGGLEGINPADIENIEILKDASSTAIYGARGTNGVIIVTTKKGEAGKFTVNLDSYYGIQDQSKKLDLLNAQQFVEVANTRAVNDGEPELFFPNPSEVNAGTNWIDELFDPSPIQSHTLTFAAGNDRVKTSQSFNYFNQDGILKNSGFERATLRNNTEVKMTEWLTVGNSLILTRSDRQFSGDGGNRAVIEAHIASPTESVYNADGTYNDVVDNDYSDLDYAPSALDNPMKWINEYDDEILSTRIFDNFYGLFTLAPNLTFKSSIGIDYTTSRTKRYIGRELLDGGAGGRAFRGSTESYSVLNENILNYKKEFGEHTLDVLAGYNWQTYNSESISASSTDFVTDLLGAEVLNDGSVPGTPFSGNSEWGLASLLGRVNYSYGDKYLLTLTARTDWSSRFAKGKQKATFPSIAAAWKIYNEGFMQNIDLISDMKLRASWGMTGNQAVSPFQTWSKVESSPVVLGGGLIRGYVPGAPANPNLKWETTSQFDVGVDLNILNNRVRFTFDYYYKKTSDLLAQVNLPSSVGFISITQNVGEMENKGTEFSIGADIIDNSSLSWDATFQISKNENKVLKLNRGADVFPGRVTNLISDFHIIREGLPLSSFYGYVNDGYDSEGNNQYLDFAGTDGEGNIVLEPDGEITEADRRVIGNPHPDFTFGFGNTFKYKNFSLNVFIEGAQGFDIVWGTRFLLDNSFSRGANQLTDALNHWTPSNTESATSPVIKSSGDFRGSTEFIEDGSYVKIRTINLAYNLPTNKIAWLSSAQVYINAQNLFTFTNYSGYDPEVSGFADGDLRLGVDNNVYPSTKVVSMGVRVGI